MRKILTGVAAVAVLLARSSASGQTAPEIGMALPVPALELASAIGLNRVDTANLPLDLVRALYASPETTTDEESALAAVQHLLSSSPRGGDRIALPLGASVWRERILQTKVSDEQLASAILGRRAFALLYYGLLGLDEETLRWLGQNPAALDHLRRHPGATAAFARSIHIRGRSGAILTPGGENADAFWTALVGIEPSRPESFIGHLLEARGGRLAFLFDTVMHLDPAHQKFALVPARGENAIARGRALLDAVADGYASWKVEDRPFTRPDVDAGLLLRLIAVTDDGMIQGLRSRGIWDRAFGDRVESGGEGGDDRSLDAAWLAGKILRRPATVGRPRLDMFLFAQRALQDASGASAATLLEALRGFAQYPALMLTLERNGVRGVAAYATAARTAAALGHDADALALCQSLLAVIDRARASATISSVVAARLASSLLDRAGSTRSSGVQVSPWVSEQLLPALQTTVASRPTPSSAEVIVLNALAGPLAASAPTIEWEGRKYRVDVAAGERRRIALIRQTQAELPLDRALAGATSSRGVHELARSLMGLVYAVALGDPDGQALAGGPVWRRHRFKSDATSEDTAWRIATENFGPDGWHLTGSLLALETSVPRLALRRLDMTDVPPPTRLSTIDRRTLSLTVASIEPPSLTNEEQDAIASAIARGRDRLRALATDRASLPALVRDAALSEWRANGVRWLLDTDAERVPSLFTLAELYRLGQRTASGSAWGAAALPLDGSLGLRPANEPWEEYSGRPATGQLGCQLTDVLLRTAEALAQFRLPAAIARDVAAFAMQEVLDRAQPAYFDDFLSIAFTARDLSRDRFEDYVSALTATGVLTPVANSTTSRQ